ncbi:MAG: cytochrome c oxidase subunit 3 [Planctomycetota bacterium]|nr:cytochrome c oxidase subunit 3 [Planctomycetota bacterium]
MSNRWDLTRVSLARQFFVATGLQFGVILLLGFTLAIIFRHPEPTKVLRLPVAFQFGTLFLAIGSWCLHDANTNVRLERQRRFRQSLLLALCAAVLFVAVQSYGMWALIKSISPDLEMQTSVHGPVIMFAGIHAMHFIVAQSVLLWVTLSAFAERYDHEYYWGVTFAGWCWHVLGVVWIAILCIFAIAAV